METQTTLPQSPNAHSDEQLANLMLRGPVHNMVAWPREGVPLTETFERARKMLPEHLGEMAGSRLRYVMMAGITHTPVPEDMDPQAHKYMDTKKVPTTVWMELDNHERIVDETSYTSLAILAELYKRTGQNEKADATLKKAFKVLQETGHTVTE
jgi:hypothetical protein